MRKVLAVSLLSLGCAAGAFAQAVAGMGGVSGTVRDATGAAVPAAAVVLSNESKGIRRSMTTTDAGVFAAPAIPPSGGYTLEVTKQGFTKYEIKAFEVLVGQTVDFKVDLQVGGATTTVDVTAEAPMVEDNKTGVSAVIDAYGRVLASLDMQQEGIIDHRLPAPRVATPYARWGDWTLLVMVAFLSVTLIGTRLWKSRQPQ